MKKTEEVTVDVDRDEEETTKATNSGRIKKGEILQM